MIQQTNMKHMHHLLVARQIRSAYLAQLCTQIWQRLAIPKPYERAMTDLTNSALITGTYRSYLVRFWQSGEHGQWRASAQCVQTGATKLFCDVNSLFTFLKADFVQTHDGSSATSVNSPQSAVQKEQ